MSDDLNYEFIIQLPKLYKQSLKKEEGAYFFDTKCRNAIFMIADEFLWNEENMKSLFLRTELSDELEEVIV